MHRTQIYLSDEQRERIAQIANDRGISKAEVIRGMLDRELGIASDADVKAEIFRETAGILKDAPGWEEWLHDARGRTADERLRDLGL
jgi:hypothetical protein